MSALAASSAFILAFQCVSMALRACGDHASLRKSKVARKVAEVDIRERARRIEVFTVDDSDPDPKASPRSKVMVVN